MSENVNNRFDDFYVEEDHFTEPKEYFKETVRLIKEDVNKEQGTLLDIGCAAGDFIRYCAQNLPDWNYAGTDLFQENLDEAKRRFPNGDFFASDMSKETIDSQNTYDVVTMLGTISIISNLNWVKHVSQLMNENGKAIIYGMVNPFPYDVFMSLKKFGHDEHECGWNSWSYKTIEKEFSNYGKTTKMTQWNVPIDIPHNEENPLRSWTIDLKNGERLTTNGSRMIHDFAFIEVS